MGTKKLWDELARVEEEVAEKKSANEKRLLDCYNQIIDWTAKLVKESEHLDGCACIDLKDVTVPDYNNNHIRIFIRNCHSFEDWKGCCFSTAYEYGANRNSPYLIKFVVSHWPIIKEGIINEISRIQSAYTRKVLKNAQIEDDLSTTLDNFVL